jgi:HlyD family secretion protein
MKKKSKKKIIIRAIIIVAILFAVYFYIQSKKPAQEKQEIITSQAVIGRVESVISGNGTLSPANQYEVKSLVKGEILNSPFEEGDTVKDGQLLYQISTSDIENNIESSQLNVKKAELTYDNYLDKKAGLQISSNESGYIKKLYVKEGDTLQFGKVIADIYNGDFMYIDLLFPSYEVESTWVGKAASISMEATGEVVKGKITNASSMEEVMKGGILVKKVTIRIKNKGGIKAGDTAEASIENIVSSNSGTFRAEIETSLVAEADGKIDRLLIKEGQWVDKGDKLLTLTSKDLDSQIESADISISEAKLTLETQKDQMKQYTIEAPISGKVITKNKKQGDTIDPATDTQAGPMAIIYDVSYLTFQLNIDELQISNIKAGQKVALSTEAFPEETFEGEIEKISLKGITNNGVTSYPVNVKLENYGTLLPGMNVTGKIIIEEADNVLTIPSSALQRDNTVYVQSTDALKEVDSDIPEGFKAVQVEIGINDGTNVEIKKGLTEGEVVYVPFSTETAENMIYTDGSAE